MNTRNDTSSNQQGSITALSVFASYVRALDTMYGTHFTALDLALSKHILNVAMKSETIATKAIWQSPYAWQQTFFDSIVAPGYDARILGRKYVIKNKIENSILYDNINQLVVLGGGYDIRTFIISLKHRNIQCFELDQEGKTRNNKINALMTASTELSIDHITISHDDDAVTFNNNLHLIKCNLVTDNLEEKLSMRGFDKTKKTLVIAEGLTMYLTRENNIELLKSKLFPLLTKGSEIFLSYLSSSQTSDAASYMQKTRQENYKFGIFPNQVVEFVSNLGFEVVGKMLASDLLTLAGDLTNAKEMSADQLSPKGFGRESYYLLKKTIESLEQITSIEKQMIENIELVDATLLRPQANCNH